MDTEYYNALQRLEIPQATFDNIISDEGTRQQIVECLYHCFTNVPSLKEVASVLLQYTAAHVHMDDDDIDWITVENGEHVPLKNGTAIGGPLKGADFGYAKSETGFSSKSKKAESAFTPKRSDYAFEQKDQYGVVKVSDFDPYDQRDAWEEINRDKLKELVDQDREASKKEGRARTPITALIDREWYGSKTEKVTPDSFELMDDVKADNVLAEKMPRNVFLGWFREADSNYKPRVIDSIISTPETRTAALSIMYENYRQLVDDTLSFEDFLTTPVKMYRGGHGQKHMKEDIFSAYSFSKSTAQKFAGNDGNVYEAEIRPIDTWGSVTTNKESEIMVPSWIAPNGNVDHADSAYDEWLEDNLDQFASDDEEKDFSNFRMKDGAKVRSAIRKEDVAAAWKSFKETRQDADDVDWITVENGTHVPIDKSGKAVGGPLEGKDFSKAQSQKKAFSSVSKSDTSNFGKPGKYQVYRSGGIFDSPLGYLSFGIDRNQSEPYEKERGKPIEAYDVEIKKPYSMTGSDFNDMQDEICKKYLGKSYYEGENLSEMRQIMSEAAEKLEQEGYDSILLEQRNALSGESKYEVLLLNKYKDRAVSTSDKSNSGATDNRKQLTPKESAKQTADLNKHLHEAVDAETSMEKKFNAAKEAIKNAPVGQSVKVGFTEYRKLFDTDDNQEKCYAIGSNDHPSRSFDEVMHLVGYDGWGAEPEFVDFVSQMKAAQDKVNELRDSGKVSGSDEVKKAEEGLINSRSSDYGKPGEYAIYRTGAIPQKGMTFFAATKEGADSYAGLHPEGTTVQYKVNLSNPLVVTGSADGECLRKAYETLHPGQKMEGELNSKSWMKADKQNAAALASSEYDSIIYIVNGKPTEIQMRANDADKKAEKLGSYTTTAWSRSGRNLERAMYDDMFKKEPDDYVRVDGREDGGPGSGNFNHKGRPGEQGGSAPGNGSREVAHGKDITKSYNGPTDIKSVIHAQGFDGLPKVVKKAEFDAAVKKSSFIAQRTYSASSQEILDAYRDQLYNGEWYVECTVGGAGYGQGMYCAADYDGELSDGIRTEILHYQQLYDRTATHEEAMETLTGLLQTSVVRRAKNDLNERFHKYVDGFDFQSGKWKEDFREEAKAFKDSDPTLYDKLLGSLRQKESWYDDQLQQAKFMSVSEIAGKYHIPVEVDVPSFTETLTLDPSAKIITYDDIDGIYNGRMAESETKAIRDGVLKKSVESLDDNEKTFVRYNVLFGTEDSVSWDEVYEAAKDMSKEKRSELVALSRSIYEQASKEIDKAKDERYETARKNRDKYQDIGAFAAALGYDAINAENHGASGSYTVVLNRTKVLFLDESEHMDSKEDSVITFQLGKDGVVYAIKDRKVVGWVKEYFSQKEEAASDRKDNRTDSKRVLSYEELQNAYTKANKADIV